MNASANHNRSRDRARPLKPDVLVEELRRGDRVALSRAITIIESTREEDRRPAAEIIRRCVPHSGASLRIGITGAPGVGKSTFIEALAGRLTRGGRHVAVLAVDPTSTISRGSILGDKTRMEKLAQDPNAFIRPSPTGGTSGGVARMTRESIIVCEAAGFDTVLVETVGVGQSDTAVRSMVDFFLLLTIPGAGDELQGIKRGILELADALVVNKVEDARAAAERARNQLQSAIRLLPAAESGWLPRVLLCSALLGSGLDEIWSTILEFEEKTRASGHFERQRRSQLQSWLREAVLQRLQEQFLASGDVRAALTAYQTDLERGVLDVWEAAEAIVGSFRRSGASGSP